uniref:Secreted protein n=1 Tax=Timema monikensis TaxID=170555 RepID=A0A7R9HN06_9NEOP|nr:unnamed protein product [Timema monikensis]
MFVLTLLCVARLTTLDTATLHCSAHETIDCLQQAQSTSPYPYISSPANGSEAHQYTMLPTFVSNGALLPSWSQGNPRLSARCLFKAQFTRLPSARRGQDLCEIHPPSKRVQGQWKTVLDKPPQYTRPRFEPQSPSHLQSSLTREYHAANQKPEFVFATRMKAHVFARACIYVILTLFLQDINAGINLVQSGFESHPCQQRLLFSGMVFPSSSPTRNRTDGKTRDGRVPKTSVRPIRKTGGEEE